MIILVNPRATRSGNRRFPLSVMAVGASIPEGEDWEIVDGNVPNLDVASCISDMVEARSRPSDPVRAMAFTVMPGSQLANAVPLTRKVKAQHPDIAIVWGGNFGSLYPEPVLNALWSVRLSGGDCFAFRAITAMSLLFAVKALFGQSLSSPDFRPGRKHPIKDRYIVVRYCDIFFRHPLRRTTRPAPTKARVAGSGVSVTSTSLSLGANSAIWVLSVGSNPRRGHRLTKYSLGRKPREGRSVTGTVSDKALPLTTTSARGNGVMALMTRSSTKLRSKLGAETTTASNNTPGRKVPNGAAFDPRSTPQT